jgi:hypothetical protein
MREVVRRRDINHNSLAQQGIKKTRTPGFGKHQVIAYQGCS